MDSWPPATTTSNSPARMSWSASAMASMPDKHILLMVSDGTSQPMPAATADCRAGIWPAPAVSTWPMITYSTSEAGTLAFSSAPLIAMAPRSLALKSFSAPISWRIGDPETFPPGYRYGMATDQVDARRRLSTALVTAVDRGGIAVPDLDAA